jgi:hypothetical protein
MAVVAAAGAVQRHLQTARRRAVVAAGAARARLLVQPEAADNKLRPEQPARPAVAVAGAVEEIRSRHASR